jgi:mevalonate kinase
MRVVASAPGKVILLGEHAVNREQPALAAAIDRRIWCQVTPLSGDSFYFESGERMEEISRESLITGKALTDRYREAGDIDELRASTRDDFFAPTRYVLAHVAERCELSALTISWRSDLPIGSGTGSGAAASASMAMAALRTAGVNPALKEIAFLAWQGDVIAHGGVASGLDSGASALGGVTRYTVNEGPTSIPNQPLTVVIADTGVVAKTADINTGVRWRLSNQPSLMRLFPLIGYLSSQAEVALAEGDIDTLGRLMNLNQLVLERLGVSCPEIDRLVAAATEAGAYGAKLSGSGGGGIVVALPPVGEAESVAAAMISAGGKTMIVEIGTEGVRIEESDLLAA